MSVCFCMEAVCPHGGNQDSRKSFSGIAPSSGDWDSRYPRYFNILELLTFFSCFSGVDAEQSVVICFQQVLLVACFRFSHLGWVNLDYNGNLFTKMEIISEQRIKIFIPGIKLVDTNNQNSYGRGLVLGIKYNSRQLAQRL